MHTYTAHNARDNVTACVAETPRGFAVTLYDDDSGNVLPFARVYPDRAAAVAYADILAGIGQPTGATYVYL
jgi:hypothetical protein